ncbi:MAG TPA: 1,4-dihydroxy-2-naphthoate polyprenyltransferase [Acidimicrobiales bacterium]|nr:1,4-dihydroxy-2-naphthoate polyprenyltransferase [Acidimicrobiales bacterium]
MSVPFKLWWEGARPRTLPAAIVPVVVGTAAGYLQSGQVQLLRFRGGAIGDRFVHHLSVLNALLALVVALGIQIGTNYVNDYADGVRGTDDTRAGPVRLVAGKLATVQQVKIAAGVAFGVAGVAGLLLAVRVTWWFVLVGVVCVVAGWAYTGGPRPYGYMGFGELFVFLFFGLVATAGSAYVQHAPFLIPIGTGAVKYDYNWPFVLWTGVPVGLLSAALLQANNLRDIDTDAAAGKKTLAVRLGRENAGYLYVGTLMCVALSIGILHQWRSYTLVALLALPLAFYPVRMALSDRSGRRLLPLLGATSRLQLAVGALLTAGLLLLNPG